MGEVSNQQIIVDLINRRFDDINNRLDVIVAGNEQRSLEMSAKHKENSDRLDRLEARVDFIRGILWVIGGIGTVFGWLLSQLPAVWQAIHKA